MIDLCTASLFGAHVRRCPNDRPCPGELCVAAFHRTSQPEVENLAPANAVGRFARREIAFEPDVRRFDVAVNEALRVGRGQTLRDLVCHFQKESERQRTVAFEPRIEHFALEEGHHDERSTGGRFADIQNRHDVVVFDGRRGAGFAFKPVAVESVRREFGAHRLDRDLAAEFRVFGEVDGPHPAFAELPHHDEFANA